MGTLTTALFARASSRTRISLASTTRRCVATDCMPSSRHTMTLSGGKLPHNLGLPKVMNIHRSKKSRPSLEPFRNCWGREIVMLHKCRRPGVIDNGELWSQPPVGDAKLLNRQGQTLVNTCLLCLRMNRADTKEGIRHDW